MQAFFEQTYWNNTVLQYVICSGALLVSIIILTILKRVVLRRLHKRAEKTKTKADDMVIRAVRKNLVPLLFVLAFFLCTKILELGDTIERIIGIVTLGFIMVFGAMFLSSIIFFLLNRQWERKGKKVDKMAVKWIAALIKIIIWVAAMLIFLDNIDVEITTLVAGLGISGIAIAFAAQAVLEDVFSFVTIFFDKPFELGDLIIVDDLSGTVEHIGIKTTRLRSLGREREQFIFSNKDLTSSRVKNLKRRENRRVVFTLGVTYDTTVENLRAIPGMIELIVKEVDNAAFDRTHFASYGDFSLNFEIAYFVLNQDFEVYMDTRQEINLRIKEAFDLSGIEFAFPTQTLILQNAQNREG